jgi:hypothetical protein
MAEGCPNGGEIVDYCIGLCSCGECPLALRKKAVRCGRDGCVELFGHGGLCMLADGSVILRRRTTSARPEK